MRYTRTILIAAVLALAASLLAPARASAQSDSAIAQQKVPVCLAGSSTPYPWFDPSAGQWKCSAQQQRWVKNLDGVLDATSTPIFTVTLPPGPLPYAGSISVTIVGALGPGGSIGDYECVATLKGTVSMARPIGATTVVNAATAAVTSNACVSGAGTITLAYAVSSITGTTGTNTFTINATITKQVGHGGTVHHLVAVADLQTFTGSTGISIK